MAAMQYRKLPHGDEQISVLGLGMGYIHESSEQEIERTVRRAIECGINYFDMVASEAKPYPAYARAFEGQRDKVYLQMHFGAVYRGGEYGWTRDLSEIKQTFQQQLALLHTDYTDMGYLHCVDELDDLEDVLHGGLWDYMKGLKQEGVIRHLGLSSHNPEVVRRMLDTGLVDMLMFSINPAYDYEAGKEEVAIGSLSERGRMYQECEKAGAGIAVMKPFGGGQLLDARLSPFGRALTETQCIQYALDRPAVLTVLPGVRGLADLDRVLTYLDAGEQDRDYGVLGEVAPQNADGVCVYCNHCRPCPQGINVGLVNKYYDLARVGDTMARSHYEKLSVRADACVQCGHCDARCPFHVGQQARMQEIDAYFSKGAAE